MFFLPSMLAATLTTATIQKADLPPRVVVVVAQDGGDREGFPDRRVGGGSR